MSVDKNMPARFTFLQKLLITGSGVLILAFSAWRFSLIDTPSDMIAIQVGFHTLNQAQMPGFEIEDLRFYVHQLELRASDGQVFPIQLNPSKTHKGIALVDLSSTPALVISGLVPNAAQSASIHSLAFKLGVPFASNHANPLQAQPPLNDSGMFWVWQQGYKFFKLDIRGTSDQGISYHMGSAGCESASALRPPSVNCNYPNRAEVVLNVADMQRLNIGVNPWTVLRTMQSQQVQLCTAAANFSSSCSSVMTLFGIDPLRGLCDNGCLGQKVFSISISSDV